MFCNEMLTISMKIYIIRLKQILQEKMNMQNQNGREKKNIYSGFIFFFVLIALVAALTIYMLNHNKIFSEVLYEQKLAELENRIALTITHKDNLLIINTKSAMKLKIKIDSESYSFKLSEDENKLSFAIYDSPENMLSINNQQNSKQNYLHKIPANSTFSLILPSELSINMQDKPEILILGVINSEIGKTMIHAEFSKDEATNEN